MSSALPRVYPDDPNLRPQTLAHHTARYEFAAGLVRQGDQVLDLMCGTGYGSDILRRAGGVVLGVDADFDAIAYADRHYAGNLFFVADAAVLSIRSHWNMVTWFEGIEHLTREDGLGVFRQVARGLRHCDGTLILSTPRDLNEKYNRWHLCAWPLEHLLLTANSLFSSVEAYGQDWDTAAITPDAKAEDDFYILVCR